MSDERTIEELVMTAVSYHLAGSDRLAAARELERRANEAHVYKRALEIASRCIVGHCSPDTLIDMARKELGL